MIGSCLCGNVEFNFEPLPGLLGNCHCKACRKSHGAPFTTWLIALPSSFNLVKGSDYLSEYNYTPPVGRVFCKECGSRLWDYEKTDDGDLKKTGLLSVAASAVDSEIPYPIGCHFNVESKASWYEITDDLPQFTGWPDQEFMQQQMAKFTKA